MSGRSRTAAKLRAEAAAEAADNGELVAVGKNPYTLQELADRYRLTVPPNVPQNVSEDGARIHADAYWDAEHGMLVYDLEVSEDGSQQ